jgi:hypothetical protein
MGRYGRLPWLFLLRTGAPVAAGEPRDVLAVAARDSSTAQGTSSEPDL